MNLFRRPENTTVPEGTFVKCDKCQAILIAKDFAREDKVCPKCGWHHTLTPEERIASVCDADTFVEHDAHLFATDLLTFPEYASKLEKGVKVTGRNDGMVAGSVQIQSLPCEMLLVDFRFMGGSMGSVFGEKFCRAADRAMEKNIPLIIFVASGGARMQEGLTSLMQMAKTSLSIAQMRAAKVPYVVVCTNPTIGGALASFASLGDVVYAEPSAKMALSGERVAAQAQTTKPPANFQTAEFLEEHGFVDRVVPRKEMQNVLGRTLRFFAIANSGTDNLGGRN
jgi:acetyl-CoA carboxylase carboxyl transferase subunit beta